MIDRSALRAAVAMATSMIAGLQGCTWLLEMYPPLLDPCADAGCADGAVTTPEEAALHDVSSPEPLDDVATDPPAEASIHDADGHVEDASQDEEGSPGGGPCGVGPGAWCDAGVCCHFTSSTKCESKSQTCGSGLRVCDPGAPDACPAGFICNGLKDAEGSPLNVCFEAGASP